jgi:hypothetical protein
LKIYPVQYQQNMIRCEKDIHLWGYSVHGTVPKHITLI